MIHKYVLLKIIGNNIKNACWNKSQISFTSIGTKIIIYFSAVMQKKYRPINELHDFKPQNRLLLENESKFNRLILRMLKKINRAISSL